MTPCFRESDGDYYFRHLTNPSCIGDPANPAGSKQRLVRGGASRRRTVPRPGVVSGLPQNGLHSFRQKANSTVSSQGLPQEQTNLADGLLAESGLWGLSRPASFPGRDESPRAALDPPRWASNSGQENLRGYRFGCRLGRRQGSGQHLARLRMRAVTGSSAPMRRGWKALARGRWCGRLLA